MVRRHTRWILALLAVSTLAACNLVSKPNPTATPTSKPATSVTETTAPMLMAPTALFYTKAGSLYISDPAGTAGRKLTDGPADAQPAPSPDLMHVAYIRKANVSDYGGELWVLDLNPEREPLGAPRRLVDPAGVPTRVDGAPGRIVSPRWSPGGQQIAFLDNKSDGMIAGGLLVVAAADTGAVVSSPQPMFADAEFAWSPDGRHIAWTDSRSDVSPVAVNAYEVGTASMPVAKDTNAFSVTYSKDGRAILFSNGDASGQDFTAIPFAIRAGGIYSVATPTAATALFTKPGSYYADVAALDSGAVAFTEQHADDSAKTIRVLDAGSSLPRTTVTNVTTDGPGPAWGPGDFVAYLDTSPGGSLVVTDRENRAPRQIDTNVDAFAWPARTSAPG